VAKLRPSLHLADENNWGLLDFHDNDKFSVTQSCFIRNAFMVGRPAYDELKNE
jgi:hypothetical protein